WRDAKGTTRDRQEREHQRREQGSPSRKRAGATSCRVYYSVEKDLIGVVLKDPQMAYRLPELALATTEITKVCLKATPENAEQETGEPESEHERSKSESRRPENPSEKPTKRAGTPEKEPARLLELVPLDSENPEVAAYKLHACKSEKEALWLARQLAELEKTSAVVKAAGVLVHKRSDPGQYVLIDELLVRFAEPVPDLDSNIEALLKKARLEFIAPDPFDPRHGILLRAIHGSSVRGGSSLDGIDVLTCAAGTGHPDQAGESRADAILADVLTCAGVAGDPDEARKRAIDADALEAFMGHRPELVRPTLIPVSTKAPGADFAAWLKAERKKEDELTSKITLNSVSNDTDSADNARLWVDAAVKQGSYQGQLRFALGAQVEFKNETVEENVTNLVVNYDHYFRPWFEIYGFAERFSNSYMGIDQRWEGGGGILLEYDGRARSRDRFCDSRGGTARGYSGREVKLTRRARERMAQYKDVVRQELLREGFIERDTLEEYCSYAPGIAKRNAKLQLGLALSAFSDFEQPKAFTLTARWADEREEDPATMELTPSSSQRLHFTVRPNVTWRPSSGLQVDALYYHKFAADPQDAPWGGSDQRGQWTVAVDFTLSDASPKVSLTGSWTRYEDSRPPRLSAVDVFEQFGLTGTPPDPAATIVTGLDALERLVEIDGFVAEDVHTVVKFGVAVSF
ncbi:MAG: DUF481 domain-containing protein, partial [Acidobacteriota bacterium]|nr:DUF481 domain-containing protein [Acidobacteriota bacterium]